MASDRAGSNGLGRVALGSTTLPQACEKFYPKCCSYHEGWDDAFSLLHKVANVVYGEVHWLSEGRADSEMKALFVVRGGPYG